MHCGLATYLFTVITLVGGVYPEQTHYVRHASHNERLDLSLVIPFWPLSWFSRGYNQLAAYLGGPQRNQASQSSDVFEVASRNGALRGEEAPGVING